MKFGLEYFHNCIRNGWARIRAAVPFDRGLEIALIIVIAFATFGNFWVDRWLWLATNRSNEIALRPIFKIVLEPEAFIVHLPREVDDFSGVKFKIENIGRFPGLSYVGSAVDWLGNDHELQEGKWPIYAHTADVFLFPSPPDAEFSSEEVPFTPRQLERLVASPETARLYVAVEVKYAAMNGYDTKVCSYFLFERTSGLRLGKGAPCGDRSLNSAN